MELRLGKKDLAPYGGRNLQAFNDSITHPCRTKEIVVSFGEGKDRRKLDMYFLEIPCENVYSFILGRPLYAT